MSRIGRLPIELPAGVTITVNDDNAVVVKGPKGELARKFDTKMDIQVEGNLVTIGRPDDEKRTKAFHGLSRALLNNMVTGVSQGFEKGLEIVGVGYRAQMNGKKLVINVGYSHPVEIDQPEGITFEVPSQTSIIVRGIDKQKVGQVAANIRAVRKPEPYKGKGIRYVGEYVRRKEGKTGM